MPAPSTLSVSPTDWSRRQFLRGLSFGTLGLGLADLLRVQAAPLKAKKAKACIILWLFGGPSHIDIWDMKPDAPAEYRGEFNPVATSAPGIRICEHLPRTAKLAHHLALVRSVTMSERVIGNGDHHADTYYMLTGHRPDRSFFVESINRKPHPDDWPFLGSAIASKLRRDPELPAVVQVPARSGEITGYINPGQFSGMLGPDWEPVMVRGTLEKPRDLSVPAFAPPADVDPDRMSRRRNLVARLDSWQRQMERPGSPLDALETHRQKAFALLTSERAKRAFDLDREPPAVRDRYGPDVNCQSVLLARRLVESGVPVVCVHWIAKQVGAAFIWDTHGDNFGQLKNHLLPSFDACYTALLQDLEMRGLLDETLVVVMAEMGRTPKIGDPRTGGKGPPGRDHWVHCQTAILAGGGIRGGQVYGSSDRVGAYPANNPVHPEDLAATVFRAFGIEDMTAPSKDGRPISLMPEGNVLPLSG